MKGSESRLLAMLAALWLAVAAAVLVVDAGSGDAALRAGNSQVAERELDELSIEGSASGIEPRNRTKKAIDRFEDRYTDERVEIDSSTGTVRSMTRWEGDLGGRQSGTPRQIAEHWLRDNYVLIGIDRNDLKTLRFRRSEDLPGGDVRLRWRQQYRGIPAYGNGLTFYLKNRRISAVQGSPHRNLKVSSIKPRITASRALITTAENAQEHSLSIDPHVRSQSSGPNKKTTFTSGHSAQLVLFNNNKGNATLAWEVFYDHPDPVIALRTVVDATTGRLLERQNTVQFSHANVWSNYPEAPVGGVPIEVDLGKWLLPNQNTLTSDRFKVSIQRELKGDLQPVTNDNAAGHWLAQRTPFFYEGGNCPNAGCDWKHTEANSWEKNIKQAAIQTFYFLNRFADHLAEPPIYYRSKLVGENAVEVILDAAGEGGFPQRVNNASAEPRFEESDSGISPELTSATVRLQMFQPSGPKNPFASVFSSNTQTTAAHEFTHIMLYELNSWEGSLRRSPVNIRGPLEEGLADWYAVDFLLKSGYLTDTDQPGEVNYGSYLDGGRNIVRTQPLDCTVGAPVDICPRNRARQDSSGKGGYTYANLGRILESGPEPHADGEIVSQTLLDLRRELTRAPNLKVDVKPIQRLVTEAVGRLPGHPSLLDLRDGILAANDDPQLERKIWKVFAERGMGVDAKALDVPEDQSGEVTHYKPVADFQDRRAGAFKKSAFAGDRSFGSGGLVTLPSSKSKESLSVVALDGSTIWTGGLIKGQNLLLRVSGDGKSIDAGATTDIPGRTNALAIQSDRKILRAVGVERLGLALDRFNPDLRPDGTFGGASIKGRASLEAPALTPKPLKTITTQPFGSMALQPDGKIVVTGVRVGESGRSYGTVWRVQADGKSLDPSFNVNGIRDLEVEKRSPNEQKFLPVAVQKDGKILIGEGGDGLGLWRLNPDGTRDREFGEDGKAAIPRGFPKMFGGRGAPRDMVLQNDGKIVVVGYHGDDAMLWRFDAYGALDDTFGKDGVVRITRTGECCSSANAVALLFDDKIVVTGNQVEEGRSSLHVWRFHPNGEPDAERALDIDQDITSVGNDLVVQPDSKVVVVGARDDKASIWRLNP